MLKFVKYNGRSDYFYPCTEPNELVAGKEYKVISENVHSFHTDYILEGVEGKFNSVWFDEVNIFLAHSNKYPNVGEKFECLRIENSNGVASLKCVHTSDVKEVIQAYGNLYYVKTANSIYMVQIG